MIVSATVMSPCKDCTDRCIGCHSTCERYKEYKDTLEINRAKIATKNDEIEFNHSVKREVWRRYNKRRRGDDR